MPETTCEPHLNDLQGKECFLVGIGGVGVSALAQLLTARGAGVSGSDRNADRGINRPFYERLERAGVRIFPQDGSGIGPNTDFVIASSAVESGNPDLEAAAAGMVPVVKRAEVLARLFEMAGNRIAIAGTSGKTTITGMVAWCLKESCRDYWAMVGGFLRSLVGPDSPGNVLVRGNPSETACIEADESDGSIVLYRPSISLISNIGLDHRHVHELVPLFREFAARTTQSVCLNADAGLIELVDCPVGKRVTFGIRFQADVRARHIQLTRDACEFRVEGQQFRINVPGLHNVYNALGAVAVCRALGMADAETSAALDGFQGILRRMELIGESGGVRVVDDFAHNPDKVVAAIAAARMGAQRLLVVFQPHGYAPMRLMREALVESFVSVLAKQDVLFLPEIYFAGGTVVRDISSGDIAEELRQHGLDVRFLPRRDSIIPAIAGMARDGDTVLVMGARDETLSDFAQSIYDSIRQKCADGA